MPATSMAQGRARNGISLVSRLYYVLRRGWKWFAIFLTVTGPGVIVMIADNDAGGITTYAATGARYGYGLLWFLIILGPVAYVIQEMTVRLGAVTKRGHAEAIFDAFGPFWGWFSLTDLILTDWLTLITEFIGMTAALSIFHVPPILTVIVVSIIMFLMVLQGRYWTWEKIAFLFCLLNLVYIPGAIMVRPSVSDIIHSGVIPNFPGGFNNDMFFFLMANIGTTIAPWMIFFQQSSVVDKSLKERDIPWGRLDTALGAFATVLVAVFIIITTGSVLKGTLVEDAAQASIAIMGFNKWIGTFLAIGLFDAGFLGSNLHLPGQLMGVRGGVRLGAFPQQQDPRSPLVLRELPAPGRDRGSRRASPRGAAGADHAFRAGDSHHAAARGDGVPDPPSQ